MNEAVGGLIRRRHIGWWWLSGLGGLFVITTALLSRRSFHSEFPIAFTVFVVVLICAVIAPRIALYPMVFFALIADSTIIPWYPAIKNMSSGESILFISNSLFVSPLEVALGATTLGWLIRLWGGLEDGLVLGALWKPLAAFTFFVVLGFFNGMTNGGDLRIAILESRTLFYLPLIYLLVTNLCTRIQVQQLLWVAMAAVLVHSILALRYADRLPAATLELLEDLGDHSAATHMAMLVALAFSMLVYRSTSRLATLCLVAMSVPVMIALISSQRRAAMIGLSCALALIVVTLWWRHRSRFLIVAPILAIAAIGYTAAFWNSASTNAVAAQAFKSVIAPDQLESKDESSDLYREIEDYDLNFTIKQAPIVGVGFGRQFLRPIPLPAITTFDLALYLPHNSILWIWVKTGFFGFASMMYMFALALKHGVTALWRERDPTASAFTIASVCFVAMYAIYTYVDISWSPSSVIVLGVSFAMCSPNIERKRKTTDSNSADPTRVEVVQLTA